MLGSGTLRIDPKISGCTFNGQVIPQLSIAKELEFWMKEELAAHAIPLEYISRVELIAELKFSIIAWGDRKTNSRYFDKARKPVKASGNWTSLIVR